MAGSGARFPEVVFLRRSDGTGYGFFYHGEADFVHAAESFRRPILHSFRGPPVPGQPDPSEHLNTALLTFIGQAFDHTVSADVGAEGISRAAAALVRATFPTAVPRVVVIERRNGLPAPRPGIEFMRHPGHPLAVVVDADTHGGEAHFFTTHAAYDAIGERKPSAECWLPQIIFKLYAKTPSVMAGKLLTDRGTGRHRVACRALDFGLGVTPIERAAAPSSQ